MLQAAVECLPFDFFAVGTDGRYVLENAVCRGNWDDLVGRTRKRWLRTTTWRLAAGE